MDFKKNLEKLRALEDKQKKIIMWAVVAVLAIIMGFFWFQGALKSLDKISNSVGQIKLPDNLNNQTENK